MKIKKPMTVKASPAEGTGGSAIADRFRLDPVDSGAASGGSVGKKSAAVALLFGLAALAVTVTLAVKISKHWESLMQA